MIEKPYDVSRLGVGLSPEFVTPEEISSLYETMEQLLQDTGERSTVGNVPAVISSVSTPVTIDETNYFARVAQLDGYADDQTKALLVFDTTPDLKVDTPNMYAIRIMQMGSNLSLVVADELSPSVDNRVELTDVQVVVAKLSEEAAIIKQEAEQKLEQERQQKHNLRRYRLGRAQAYGKVAGAVFLSISAVAGVVQSGWVGDVSRKVHENTQPYPAEFDKKDLTLRNGKVIKVGQTATAEFSLDLKNNPILQSDIPEMEYISGGTDAEKVKKDESDSPNDDTKLSASDTLRKVTIKSSKKGQNCKTIATSEDSQVNDLTVWTAFTDKNGEARADELVVKHIIGEVEVCWNGKEADESEDPAVVLSLQ